MSMTPGSLVAVRIEMKFSVVTLICVHAVKRNRFKKWPENGQNVHAVPLIGVKNVLFMDIAQ